MTPLKLALIATAATALSASAQAEAPNAAFAAFVAVCAAPAADFTAVKAAAEAHGWGPTDVAANANMPGVTIAEQMARSNTVDRVGLVLSAWRGAKGAVKISDCTVHIAKAEFGAVSDAAKTWLAFDAQESTAKRATYRFTDTAGAHKALTSADFDAAAGGAGLEILTVSGDADGTVLDLMMIKK